MTDRMNRSQVHSIHTGVLLILVNFEMGVLVKKQNPPGTSFDPSGSMSDTYHNLTNLFHRHVVHMVLRSVFVLGLVDMSFVLYILEKIYYMGPSTQSSPLKL